MRKKKKNQNRILKLHYMIKRMMKWRKLRMNKLLRRKVMGRKKRKLLSREKRNMMKKNVTIKELFIN